MAHLRTHTFTDQNISPDPHPFVHIYTYPSFPHQPTQTLSLSSCHTLRGSDPYCAINFIFVLQIDSLIYSVLLRCSLSPDLGGGRRRKHSIITFYGFIPPQQCRCHPEMAPLCYSVQRSAYFILTVYHNNEEDDGFEIIQM